MPITLPPRPRAATAPRESFLFKSMLVASVLFIGSLLAANFEFSFSAPSHSLSETEAVLRLPAR
jgi:hypothetical protein